MKTSLLASPYDLGREGAGMALGPERYLEAGADRLLGKAGVEAETALVARSGSFADEIDAAADVNDRLARLVGRTIDRGSFPLVLGGNCDSALGTLAGAGTAGLGVVWFDAHGDFNTPQNSTSGYLGGMPLSVVVGHCHADLWSRIGNDVPIPESHVVMVGTRDVEPEQRSRLEASAVTVVEAAKVREEGVGTSLRGPLAGLRSRVDEVYLHLDIDSLDPAHAPGVDFPAPDGLSVDDVEEAIEAVSRRFRIRASALTAYNPDKDDRSRTLRTGMRLMRKIVGAAEESLEGARDGR